MPVILPVPQDPTDIVMQGEQLRIPTEPYRWESLWSPLINDPPDRLPLSPTSLVANLQPLGMIDVGTAAFDPRVLAPETGAQITNNACICTPCGATIPIIMGHQWFWNDIGQSTIRFALTGITKDSAGAALGSCRVVVMESARIQSDGTANVGEGISDGSGNYSIPVPMNTAYQAIAYKAGSPDVAGITRADVVPSAIG